MKTRQAQRRMPEPDSAAAESLSEHVLGVGSPTEELLNRGVFPDGWVDRYLDLLKQVTAEFSGEPYVPRRVVWAVHFASWYLPLRYHAWSEQGKGSNEETVRQLSRIRTPSEFFIAGVDEQTDR